MATRWEEFYRLVQPHVPGCPEVVMDNHIRDAAVDFCERSEVWTYQALAEQTVDGVSDYPVAIPGSSVLENVISVHVDGLLLARVSELHSSNNPTAPKGMPRRYSVFEDQELRFFPTPDRAYTLYATVVLKPTLAASGVEDFIFRTHGRTIACGAIASLMITPGKEWTNLELAAYYKTKFSRGADDAKGRDTRRSNLRAKSVRFA